jgi:hypothetical protein
MKLIKIILPAVLVFLMGCSKIDEPKVYSSLMSTNAFQSRNDAIAAVNAVYARLKAPSGISDAWMYYAGFQVIISDLTTDVGQSNGLFGSIRMFHRWNITREPPHAGQFADCHANRIVAEWAKAGRRHR